MQKIVLSGGPSTGKTTIFNRLKETYPDDYFVEEAAERVIRSELRREAEDPSYEPILPVTRFLEFAPLVIDKGIADHSAIPETVQRVFMDRSLIDNLGYLSFNGISDFAPELNDRIRKVGYSVVFFCEWLGKLESTEIRRETEEEGRQIHLHLEQAYQQFDVPLVYLPPVSVEERLVIINNTLREITG